MFRVVPETTGMTTCKRYGYMAVDPPKIIFYGDPHIGRLLRWSSSTSLRGGPDITEQYLLKTSEYIFSGGSRWANIDERVRGIGVPSHQKQGDLWTEITAKVNSKLFVPEYVYVSMMGNDMCSLNDNYYHRLRHSDKWHLLIDSMFGPSDYYLERNHHWFDDRVLPPLKQVHFDQRKFIKTSTSTTEGQIDKVMIILRDAFPNTKFFMLAPVIRSHWFPAIRNLISKLNFYIEIKHDVKICQMNQYVNVKHIDDDKVHLTCEGYKLFMSKGLGPLLDHHWLIKKPKQEFPTELHKMTKAERKRFFPALAWVRRRQSDQSRVCMMELIFV